MLRRTSSIFVAVLGLSICGSPVFSGEKPTPASSLSQRVAAMRSAVLTNNPPTVSEVRALIDANGFDSLPESDRQFVLQSGGRLAFNESDYPLAKEWLTPACKYSQAMAECWNLLLMAAYHTSDPVNGAVALTILAERWPARLRDASRGEANRVANYATAEYIGADARLRLLESLYRAKWNSDPVDQTDYLWHELALELLRRGQTTRAREVASNLVVPGFVIGLWSDKRYDAITDAAIQRLDIRPYVARRIARAREAVAREPASLVPLHTLCNVLVDSGQLADAEQLMAATRKKLRDNPAAYRDGDPEGNLRELASCQLEINRESGRWDLVEKAYRMQVEAIDAGTPDPWDLFQLAQFYVSMDRGAEAQPYLDRLLPQTAENSELASSFHFVQHQAAQQAGNAARAKASLAWLREDKQEILNYCGALIDANELDQAAAQLIANLRDPAHRVDALLMLQEYRVFAETERAKRYRIRLDSLRDRPDVQAVALAVGRLDSYPIPRR